MPHTHTMCKCVFMYVRKVIPYVMITWNMFQDLKETQVISNSNQMFAHQLPFDK